MPENPKISVIMPNYNRERYIGEAIESVLNQTYKDFELIIVDDGSTDNSSQVISKYKDERIRLINLPHSGLSGKVRNCGIAASSGELIAFLDSDDVWMKEKLKTQINLLEIDQVVGLIHSDFQEIDENGQILTPSVFRLRREHWPKMYKLSGWCFKDLIEENIIGGTPSVLLKRKILEKVGLFDTSLVVWVDYDLWLRIARHYQIGFIDRPLYQRRLHSTNISKSRDIITYYQSAITVMERTLQHNPNIYHDHELHLSVNRKIGRWCSRLSREYFGREQYDNARKYALRAIAYNPPEPTRHIVFFLSCLLGVPSLYHSYRRLAGVDIRE